LAFCETPWPAVGEGLEFALQLGGDCGHARCSGAASSVQATNAIR
jgi:hypothetical protein